MNFEDFTKPNTRKVEMGGSMLFSTDQTDHENTPLDRDWVKQAFLVNDLSLSESVDSKNRYWSSASGKFTDTRLGANIGINSRPQFTRYADIRVKGRLAGREDVSTSNFTGNNGMGRYYSEAIDDPSQTIYLRFGVPQFNTLTNFLSQAFNSADLQLTKTGRVPLTYTVGKLAGTVFTVMAFPVLAGVIMLGKLVDYFFIRDSSKYYSLKPTMHLYWMAVNTLVNTLLINRGVLPKILNTGDDQKIGKVYTLDQEYLSTLAESMPDVFRTNVGGSWWDSSVTSNSIDMFAIANKAQRLSNQLFIADYDNNEKDQTNYSGFVKKTLSGDNTSHVADNKPVKSFFDTLNYYLTFSDYFRSKDSKDETSESDPRVAPDEKTAKEYKEKGHFKRFVEHFDSELRDGGSFAVFKVDHTGGVSESFSNSAKESDISQKLNSISSGARSMKFNFMDGQLGGGAIGEAIGGMLDGVKNIAMGTMSGLTMGFSDVLFGLAGSGYIDIPKTYDSSSASLPKTNYTIQLVSPYGNAFSLLQNIYVPLCMLLAGALPRSTGKQSYTSPFLCQLFDRGRCQIKLGMIESLSITRGVSNLNYNLRGDALAIDVSFTIADFSSILHMPVGGGGVFDFATELDEDNILSDYLAVIASQDIYSQIYPMPRAKLRLAKALNKAGMFTSPAYQASAFHDFSSNTLKWLYAPLQAAVADSSILASNGNKGESP